METKAKSAVPPLDISVCHHPIVSTIVRIIQCALFWSGLLGCTGYDNDNNIIIDTEVLE